MFLPLGTDRSLHRPTLVTHVLIVLNVAAYLLQVLAARSSQVAGALTGLGDFVRGLGVEPAVVLHPEHVDRVWTLVSYSFLHGSFMHLIGNMVFLWAFGPNVEDRLGRIGFTLFYLTASVASGLAHVMSSVHPVIGASGAIAGVTGIYLVLFPRTRIRVLVVFFIIGFFMIPAAWFIGAQVFWNIFSAGTGMSGQVAVMAHLGGYAYGFAIGWVLLATRLLGREPYDLFTISKQAKRRRDFREVDFQTKRRAERVMAGKERGVMGVDTATAEKIATARAAVTSVLTKDADPAVVGEAYRGLLSEFGLTKGACVLAQAQQYELANLLFRAEDYQTASIAYERLLEAYPRHKEAGQIRLMLGRINARYLNDPVRARDLLEQAINDLDDEQMVGMAKKELESLG